MPMDDLELDVRFTGAQSATVSADSDDDDGGSNSGDCTGDGCTGTEDSAGVTC